jgi:two-component system CheB/CheR fusion protein
VSAPVEATFPVMVIGASAGGLEAFRTLLAALPAETTMAFILVQHLDPSHKSMMVELLSPVTKFPVFEAREGVQLEPSHVLHQPAWTLSRHSQGQRSPFPPARGSKD